MTNWSLLSTPVQQYGIHSVGRNADGRLEVFNTKQNNGVTWHSWQTTPNGIWSSWASLNKPPVAASFSLTAVDENADGRLEVFTVSSDGALWHIWQTTAGGGWNNTWFSSGQPPGITLRFSPTLVRNADGRLEAFAIGSDSALWHIWQTAPNGTWSSWASLGRPSNVQFTNVLTAGKNADGRIEVFVKGNDGALWHLWQTTAGGGWYNTWFSSGQPSPSAVISGGLTVIQNADGRLEVFTVGYPDGALWHIWQTAPNAAWSSWAAFGPPPNVQFPGEGLTVGKNKDGRLEVLLTGSDGALWHLWQVTPGGVWSTLASLGAPPNNNLYTTVVSENADGRLEVFVGNNNGLWHAWQVTPGGNWG